MLPAPPHNFSCHFRVSIDVDRHPISPPGCTRRAALASVAGLAASACVTSPTLELMGSVLRGAGDSGKGSGYALDVAQIDALPYATMGLRIGRSPPAILVLANIDGESLHWASADRVVFVMQHGRLIKTVGLPRDLASTQWAALDPLPEFRSEPARSHEQQVYRYMDLRSPDDFSVPIESSFETLGDETIEILGRRHDTVRVREQVRVKKWRWSAENLFWIDKADGRIWKSRQQHCPEVPAMSFELLKPPVEAARSA